MICTVQWNHHSAHEDHLNTRMPVPTCIASACATTSLECSSCATSCRSGCRRGGREAEGCKVGGEAMRVAHTQAEQDGTAARSAACAMPLCCPLRNAARCTSWVCSRCPSHEASRRPCFNELKNTACLQQLEVDQLLAGGVQAHPAHWVLCRKTRCESKVTTPQTNVDCREAGKDATGNPRSAAP